MAFRDVFDGAVCMDAMENVCPEDWPLVLGNFHWALKQHGCLYFIAETVEHADENEIRQAFDSAQQAGHSSQEAALNRRFLNQNGCTPDEVHPFFVTHHVCEILPIFFMRSASAKVNI